MRAVIEEYGEVIIGATGAVAICMIFYGAVHISGFIYAFIMNCVNCAC